MEAKQFPCECKTCYTNFDDKCKNLTTKRYIRIATQEKLFLCDDCIWSEMILVDRINDPSDPEFGVNVSLARGFE